MRRALLAIGLALLATAASAYTFPGNSRTGNEGRPRWSSGTFTWRFNSSTSDLLPNVVDGSNPRSAIQDGFARWAAESGALPVQGSDTSTTDVGGDGLNIVTFVDTSANRTAVGGALAVTIFFTNTSNQITEADIIFSPSFTWTTTGAPDSAYPVSTVGTHEIGHWHGLAHSGVVASTMYPFAGAISQPGNSELVPESLASDDRAGINVLYPDTVFSAGTGRVTGLVTKSGLPVFGAHVVAENVATGVAVGASITLGSNQGSNNGRYDIRGLPPGTYRIYAEPLDQPATSTNWCQSFPGTDAWWDDSVCPFDTSFKLTAAASTVTVAAGTTSTRDIAVASGTPTANLAAVGLGTLNCGGGFSFSFAGLPVSVAPGAQHAVVLSGLGVEQAAGGVVGISDPGITIVPNCQAWSGSGTSARTIFKINVPGNARPGPRTLTVTMPSGEVAACVGCLEIEGPATEAGLCANGADDDGDGLTDSADIECFEDNCPSDPNKTQPGQCGCGVPDTDTDGDLTADCVDGCDFDPAKVAPGQCGCGNPETNTDGDAAADCIDECDNDPGKTLAGTCGCGVPETDTDGDGAKDCVETCDADPLKTAPGTCGCGVPETDTDADGAKDCVEACDADPFKTQPGTCGCGVPETDTDGDGAKDCVETCDADPLKTEPGTCGCGTPETDTDGDGAKDCVETCDADPGKTAPGQCGCGVADTDGDADTVADCNDNCPATPNPDQADANGNEVGDACEAVTLRLEHAASRDGGTVRVRAYLEAQPTTCVSRARLSVAYDANLLELLDVADAPAGCSASFYTPSEGTVRFEVQCSPGISGSARLADLVFGTRDLDVAEIPLAATEPEAADCESAPAPLPVQAASGSLRIGCVLGDIAPDGQGDDAVDTADLVLMLQKVLGRTATGALDLACGDVSPGTLTCDAGEQATSRWCAEGDGALRIGDYVALLRTEIGRQAFDCGACATRRTTPDPARRVAGDVAPADGDGQVTIADAVRTLRASVGLEAPSFEQRLRGDVAPGDPEGGLRVVRGDGQLGVGDVVLLLRAAVGLETLAWPERIVRVSAPGSDPVAGWRVWVSGWPAWATPSRLLADGCETTGAVSASGSAWTAACAVDGPALPSLDVGVVYRAPEPVPAWRLVVTGEVADPALRVHPVTPAVSDP